MADIERLLGPTLLSRHKARSKRNHDQHDRHVNQEDRTPVKVLQQHAANQRAKRRAARPNGSPDAKGDVTVPHVNKQRADPCKRSRNDHRRANRQRRAGGNQPARGRRKSRR